MNLNNSPEVLYIFIYLPLRPCLTKVLSFYAKGPAIHPLLDGYNILWKSPVEWNGSVCMHIPIKKHKISSKWQFNNFNFFIDNYPISFTLTVLWLKFKRIFNFKFSPEKCCSDDQYFLKLKWRIHLQYWNISILHLP